MTVIPATRLMRLGGLLLFATGALLMAFGTTSVGAFVVSAAITFGGASLFLAGKKLQERSRR